MQPRHGPPPDCKSLVAIRPRPPSGQGLAVAILAAGSLIACGVIDPVPAESSATRLWRAPPVSGKAAEAGGGSASKGTGTATADASACPDDSEFIGGLGAAICEADQRRLAYLQRSATAINSIANYNAMLWPLGAAAVHEKLRGAPNSKLILPAVLAAASYGFINAGIPKREAIYIEAARQLGCAIVGAGPDLYRWSEVDPQNVAVPHQAPHALRPALSQLALHIKSYDEARADLLADLQPRAGKPAVAGAPRSNNVFERWTAPPSGGGKAAVKGADKRPEVAAETRARLVHARAQLAEGHVVLRRLEGGATATALRGRIALIDATVHKQLAEQAPAPTSPASAASDFKTLARAIVTLQASADASEPTSAKPDPLETALPHTVYDGLDAKSADALRKFQKVHAAPLRNQVQAVGDWLARHATTRQEVAQTLEASGCTTKAEDALQDATKLVLETITRKAAERAKTSNTGSTTTTDPASGTTLPKTTP